MSRWRRQARRPRVDHPAPASPRARRLLNVTTPGNPSHPVEEVRVEHGGVYLLAHVPQHSVETYVGADLRSLHRAAEQVRALLPDRYRSRVTAALVIPTDPRNTDQRDVTASVGGVLVLDAASLATAVRCATPALSTSEVCLVEGLLRRQLRPVVSSDVTRPRRRRYAPRLRSTRTHLLDAA